MIKSFSLNYYTLKQHHLASHNLKFFALVLGDPGFYFLGSAHRMGLTIFCHLDLWSILAAGRSAQGRRIFL